MISDRQFSFVVFNFCSFLLPLLFFHFFFISILNSLQVCVFNRFCAFGHTQNNTKYIVFRLVCCVMYLCHKSYQLHDVELVNFKLYWQLNKILITRWSIINFLYLLSSSALRIIHICWQNCDSIFSLFCRWLSDSCKLSIVSRGNKQNESLRVINISTIKSAHDRRATEKM